MALPTTNLGEIEKQFIDVRIKNELKTNHYDLDSDTLTLTAPQVAAFEAVMRHWDKTFREGDVTFGFLADTISDEQQRSTGFSLLLLDRMGCVNRPGKDYTYTNNWPPDSTAGNVARTATYIWSIAGIVSLLLVLGLFIYWVHRYGMWYGEAKGVPLGEKLIDMPLTSSQLKAAKFFLVVILLFLVQTSFGGLLAHYTVHPGSFYIPLVGELIPYSWAKSWHLQLAIFWIATTWMASAIYLAPIIGGREPPVRGCWSRCLFGAVLLVAVGSLVGEVLGIKGCSATGGSGSGTRAGSISNSARFWQILLFVGLIFWLLIVYRAVGHHLQKSKDELQFTDLVLRLQRHPGGGLFRLRTVLRQRHPPDGGRLLAMVRGPHLGGEHFRVFRRCRHSRAAGGHGAWPPPRQLCGSPILRRRSFS